MKTQKITYIYCIIASLLLLEIGSVTARTGGAELIKGPYLQFTRDPSEGTITICWETKQESMGYVLYPGKRGRLRKAGDLTKSKRHEVLLPGLKPGITYNYQIVGDVSALSLIHI